MSESEYCGDVLVVDDTLVNLEVLTNMLTGEGYKVRALRSGELAIRAAENKAPDLILLDINMPGLDGYETCLHIRDNERLAGIPIIFVSGRSEPIDKVRAFESGGVDYLTKPFQLEEVRVRVETHLALRRARLALEEQNKELAAVNTRLRELERMRESLTQMIVHDMRSPLMGLIMSLHLLKERAWDGLSDFDRESVALAVQSGTNLSEMVTRLLDISRLESGAMPLKRTRRSPNQLVEEAVAALGALVRDHSIRIDCPADELVCDGDLVRRVLVNLVANAIQSSAPNKPIGITAKQGAGLVLFAVEDEGCGVAEEHLDMIFDKFAQPALRGARSGSSGLGLAFCKLAVEAHGGRIGVESTLGEGSRFWFEIPQVDRDREE